MKLDRQYQRELLEKLATRYPESFDIRNDMSSLSDTDQRKYLANIAYLDEHGLAIANLSYGMSGVSYGLPKITARGLDFLADDGGLSAVLGVVTVRFEAETIKALVAEKIEGSELPHEEKLALKSHLGNLSEAAMKEAGKYLMQQGLAHLPDAALWLQKLLSHVS